MIFISYAGLIRGAVAFGLVLRVDPEIENRRVIITTSLSLVVITTVVLGSTVATVSRCLFKEELAEKRKIAEAKAQFRKDNAINLDESVHEQMLHPNEEEILEGGDVTPRKSTVGSIPLGGKISKKGQCVKKMRDMEAKYVKPWLIHKYTPKTQK